MNEQQSQRGEALVLARELLADIELARISHMDAARKTSRLARLLDDAEAMEWLRFELAGYPSPLGNAGTRAALRSHREAPEQKVWTASLAELEAQAHGVELQMAGLSGTGSGEWALAIEKERQRERSAMRANFESRKALTEKIVGAFYAYVADRYQEMRFGSAVESAFEVVRHEVDGRIAALVPGALPMLAGAFENAASDNSEHWANAASTCRRLLKEVADALRPSGPDLERPGERPIKMGASNYVNRLVDWISSQGKGETRRSVIASELEFLGRRLDAADKAGQKGAHEHVDRPEASRYITATYLLLGDILALGTKGE